MLLDQLIISATGSENFLDFFVVQAREEDTSREEGLLQAIERIDVDLSSHAQALTILNNFFEMSDSRRGSLVHLAALEESLELGKCLIGCVYLSSVMPRSL
jgi:hypothetical protein